MFLEQGLRLTNAAGLIAYIMSSQWMTTDYGRKMRAFLSHGFLREVIDFGSLPVFASANTYPAVLVVAHCRSPSISVRVVENLEEAFRERGLERVPTRSVSMASLSDSPWNLGRFDIIAALRSGKRSCQPLSVYGKAYIGTITGMDAAFVLTRDAAKASLPLRMTYCFHTHIEGKRSFHIAIRIPNPW